MQACGGNKVVLALALPMLEGLRAKHLGSRGPDAVKCAWACNWLSKIAFEMTKSSKACPAVSWAGRRGHVCLDAPQMLLP